MKSRAMDNFNGQDVIINLKLFRQIQIYQIFDSSEEIKIFRWKIHQIFYCVYAVIHMWNADSIDNALESIVKEVLQNEPQGLNTGQGKQVVLAAYADDIVVIAETEDSLERTTDILIDATKMIGLIINENKTKFMIVSRREHSQNALTVKDLSFERVRNL
uniref:Reverse transcriptase domain-containing protein n=1 Tax=Schizaphis graminum TaxID=13262 RepID=A0A2S2P497_SCHGA